MFIRLLLLIVFSFTSYSAYANKIIAIVNDNVITSSQLEARKDMVRELYKIEGKKAMSPAELESTSLDMLVTERLMIEISGGMDISEKELEANLLNYEEARKLSRGYIKKNFGSKLHREYLAYIKYQMIWGQFIQSDIMSTIAIFPSDIDSFIVENGGKDISFRFHEIKSKKYPKLKRIKEKLGKLKEMRGIKKSSNIEINEVTANLSKLTPEKLNILRNLHPGDTSNIIDNGDDEYSMFFVESREIINLSDQEKSYIYNIVGSGKMKDMIKQVSRILHKRAYIEKRV